MAGRSLCGTVRLTDRPPILFRNHCHCHWCRRAHGAAFVTWFSVPEAFGLTRGADQLVWYAWSEQGSRAFCSRCGTTFLFRSELIPGQMHIALANVDSDAVDWVPHFHSFFEAHVPWVSLADELPRLQRQDELLKMFAAVPQRPPGE